MRFPWHTLLACSLTAFAVTACGADAEDEDDNVVSGEEATSDEELRSSGFGNRDMIRIATPAGLPEAWDQPDTTGIFKQNGKCGPTAVANILRLYGIEVSPKEAEAKGVKWLIGSTIREVGGYFDKHQPALGCESEYPKDGAAFLRENLAAGRPVMVWYNIEGTFLGSHWVTAVGTRQSNGEEQVVVMSWGNYYAIPMDTFVEAWRLVYGLRHPAVVCDRTTKLMSR